MSPGIVELGPQLGVRLHVGVHQLALGGRVPSHGPFQNLANHLQG